MRFPSDRTLLVFFVCLMLLAGCAFNIAFAETATVAPGPVATVTTQVTSSDPAFTIRDVAGQALTWAATAFGSVIGTLVTAWLWKLIQLTGIQVKEELRDKLQAIIVNGINVAAAEAADQLKNKTQIEAKEAIKERVVEYTKIQAADTIKKLGSDPNSPEVKEAIEARIETAIVNPATPTPLSVTPQVAPAPAAVAALAPPPQPIPASKK